MQILAPAVRQCIRASVRQCARQELETFAAPCGPCSAAQNLGMVILQCSDDGVCRQNCAECKPARPQPGMPKSSVRSLPCHVGEACVAMPMCDVSRTSRPREALSQYEPNVGSDSRCAGFHVLRPPPALVPEMGPSRHKAERKAAQRTNTSSTAWAGLTTTHAPQSSPRRSSDSSELTNCRAPRHAVTHHMRSKLNGREASPLRARGTARLTAAETPRLLSFAAWPRYR